MPINPVVFQTPNDATVEALRDAMVADDYYSTLFDSGNLRLFLNPSEYKRSEEGEPSKLIDGYSSVIVQHTARRVGFEFTTSEARDKVVPLLRAIARWSRINASTITVLDYHHLEDESAIALGYTARIGVITQIEPLGGTVRRSTDADSPRYGKGFRLQFWEKELREYW